MTSLTVSKTTTAALQDRLAALTGILTDKATVAMEAVMAAMEAATMTSTNTNIPITTTHSSMGSSSSNCRAEVMMMMIVVIITIISIVITTLKGKVSSPSSFSSAFPALSLGFTILGEIFAYVTVLLVQP